MPVALPITATLTPQSADDVVAAIRDGFERGTAIYPIGGGTSLDYGLTAKMSGVGLSLSKLNRLIDYPARDMTITAEAGITMRQLAETLAAERQQLPIDVPQADRATLGGVIATNWNGPRRFGLGSLRDYVIGISAVDGRGMSFKGGGRVVKNVAGYDFCKLLTGSCGMLGVITQATLRVRPLPEKSVLLAGAVADLVQAEVVLAALSSSDVTPTSIVLLAGRDWSQQALLNDVCSRPDAMFVVVGLEGSQPEVDWMVQTLSGQWRELVVGDPSTVTTDSLMPQLIEWPAQGDSPLVLKASLRPGSVTRFVGAVREVDPNCSVLSHAGSGVVFVRLSEFPKQGLSRALIGKLQPAAADCGGHVVILHNPSGTEMTQQAVWGGDLGALDLMRAVKRNFDPKGILNPGRFVV